MTTSKTNSIKIIGILNQIITNKAITIIRENFQNLSKMKGSFR